jgi:hypothetical protein
LEPRAPNSAEIEANQDGKERSYIRLENGAYSGHSYAVVTVAEVQDEQDINHKLVKLRNPWINEIWTGSWSHESQFWTQELKERLNYWPETDGGSQFWVTSQEMFNTFAKINFHKTRPGFVYNSIPVTFPKNKRFLRSIVRLSIAKPGKYSFTISQKTILPCKPQTPYNSMKMTLGKIEKTGFQLLCHRNSENLKNTDIRFKLAAGEYYLLIEQKRSEPLIEPEADEEALFDVVVSSYGPHSCGLKLIKDQTKAELMYDFLYYYGWRGYSLQNIGNKLSEFKVNFYDGSSSILELFQLQIPDCVIYAFRQNNPFGVILKSQIGGIENMEILGPEGVIGLTQKFIMNSGQSDVFVVRVWIIRRRRRRCI